MKLLSLIESSIALRLELNSLRCSSVTRSQEGYTFSNTIWKHENLQLVLLCNSDEVIIPDDRHKPLISKDKKYPKNLSFHFSNYPVLNKLHTDQTIKNQYHLPSNQTKGNSKPLAKILI